MYSSQSKEKPTSPLQKYRVPLIFMAQVNTLSYDNPWHVISLEQLNRLS